jgi:APA family basic amino acid/polyamine antiporter
VHGQLHRTLRLPHATALVVGTIIGSAVFVQASEVTHHVPNILGVLLVWVVSGVLTLFGALACAELATAFPRTGGVYVFLREIYTPLVGFLWGWAMFWVMHSGIIAAMSMVFARYAGVFVPLDDRGMRAVAVAAILVNSAINYAGVKRSSTLQTSITVTKVLAVALIVTVGFVIGSKLPSHYQYSEAGGLDAAHFGLLDLPTAVSEFLLAVVAGLFAFGGWHVVTYTAEETVQPERTIPRALGIGIAIVTAAYVALNAVYFYILPVDKVLASTRVAADAAAALLGNSGAAGISALVMFSVFGAMMGSILAAPRVYFAMAKDGLLFQWVNRLHPRFGTPHRAIALQAVWASVLVLTGTYRQLFSRVIFTEWIFFALMAAGIFLLRQRPDYQPAYRVWGYPWAPIVFVLASIAIVINRLIAFPIDSGAGLALVAAGIPVYYVWCKPRPSLAEPQSTPVPAVHD